MKKFLNQNLNQQKNQIPNDPKISQTGLIAFILQNNPLNTPTKSLNKREKNKFS